MAGNPNDVFFLDELVEKTGAPRTSIVWWIKEGLIKPFKVGKNKIMLFDGDALRTVIMIKKLKDQNVSLRDIKAKLGVTS